MAAIDWIVIASAAALIAAVNWYFFGGSITPPRGDRS
jgi:hypothetical protein